MLEVVEQQQDLLPLEVGDERILGALTGLLAHAQGDADRHLDELGIPERREEGTVDAVLVVGEALAVAARPLGLAVASEIDDERSDPVLGECTLHVRVACAVIGIAVIIIGDFGEFEIRVLLTMLTITVTSILGGA